MSIILPFFYHYKTYFYKQLYGSGFFFSFLSSSFFFLLFSFSSLLSLFLSFSFSFSSSSYYSSHLNVFQCHLGMLTLHSDINCLIKQILYSFKPLNILLHVGLLINLLNLVGWSNTITIQELVPEIHMHSLNQYFSSRLVLSMKVLISRQEYFPSGNTVCVSLCSAPCLGNRTLIDINHQYKNL